MGLKDLLFVAFYRRYIIIWTVLVATIVATIAGVLLPKQYQSTARVQVDSIQRNNLTGDIEPRVKVSEFLGQQAAIAGSRTVALNVIDTLTSRGYINLADLEENWRKETKGELVAGNDLRLWAGERLIKKLSIEAKAMESTLGITYRGADPAQAARIANAFADAYMKTVLDQKKRRASRNAETFSLETQALADNVIDAQQDLANFRSESGILPLGVNGAEAAEVELAALTARLAEARADNSEAQSLMRQARNASLDELSHFPIPDDALPARQAQLRLSEVNSRLARIAERYGQNFPDYIEAEREKQALEATILGAIRDRALYASQRLAALEVEAENVKVTASAAATTRDAYQLLQNKVAASQNTFNLVSNRSLQEALQARVDTVEVLLLARALPASRPMAPPTPLITMLGAGFGMFLGASIAVLVELLEGRARSPMAVSHVLHAPVIGELDKNENKSRARSSVIRFPTRPAKKKLRRRGKRGSGKKEAA